MSEPFDARQTCRRPPRRLGGAAAGSADAATLILFRGGASPEVLMGRRAKGHVFMASKWVFPGGRLERSDYTAASATPEPTAEVMTDWSARSPPPEPAP